LFVGKDHPLASPLKSDLSIFNVAFAANILFVKLIGGRFCTFYGTDECGDGGQFVSRWFNVYTTHLIRAVGGVGWRFKTKT
jgi:hypothetical protein